MISIFIFSCTYAKIVAAVMMNIANSNNIVYVLCSNKAVFLKWYPVIQINIIN